jgi:hypothetical protein
LGFCSILWLRISRSTFLSTLSPRSADKTYPSQACRTQDSDRPRHLKGLQICMHASCTLEAPMHAAEG